MYGTLVDLMASSGELSIVFVGDGAGEGSGEPNKLSKSSTLIASTGELSIVLVGDGSGECSGEPNKLSKSSSSNKQDSSSWSKEDSGVLAEAVPLDKLCAGVPHRGSL